MEHVAKYFQKTIEICLIILREFSAEKKCFICVSGSTFDL